MSLDVALRMMVAELAALGLDPAAICAAAGVDPRALHDEGGVPLGLAELARILAAAEQRSGDPLLGLHLAERTPGRGVLAYLARTQPTVGDGLASFARYAAANWGAPDAVRLQRQGEDAAVVFRFSPALARHATEYTVARTAIALGRGRTPARQVWFSHAPGGAEDEYERVLRCRVRFRAPDTRVVVRAADLDRRQRTANPQAAAALAAALARTPPGQAAPVADRLAYVVDAALARGESIDREALARVLGMSGKTLARRLAEDGHSFRDVVESVRRALAEQLLADERAELSQVAGRLGFADLAAFGKAFRRWFGESPSAFRARR
ncbi:MAG: AraC family transcriptional regulator ligand-binding domain-containing protein [Deltaproteobacteria bacterium]|nr:AraC family transcriptional regulator ligand-binding domain-containing protein [Deltaproteobacteria bacterium]